RPLELAVDLAPEERPDHQRTERALEGPHEVAPLRAPLLPEVPEGHRDDAEVEDEADEAEVDRDREVEVVRLHLPLTQELRLAQHGQVRAARPLQQVEDLQAEAAEAPPHQEVVAQRADARVPEVDAPGAAVAEEAGDAEALGVEQYEEEEGDAHEGAAAHDRCDPLPERQAR